MPETDDNLEAPRSTGPRTPAGKATSSQNARKHGCCSNRLILPDESEQEWNDLVQGWLDDYEPGTQSGRSLVVKAAEAEWFLLRALRRHQEAEQALAAEEPDMLLWSDEQHRKLERMLRYRTTAERAFARALSNVERVRKSRGQETDRRMRQQERAVALDERQRREAAKEVKPEPVQTEAEKPVFRAQNAKKNLGTVHTLEQWVEVDVVDGKTVTRLFPSNEELIEDGKKMDPPPDMVYRRLHFVGIVPPEYYWATGDPKRRETGGIGLQRMTAERWLEVIEEEKARGTGISGRAGGTCRGRKSEAGASVRCARGI